MIVENAQQISRVLEKLSRFSEDVRRDCLKRLAAEVKNRTKKRFTTKRAPDGSRWEKWSESYRATRSSRHSLLFATGLMLRSISVRSSSEGITIGSPRTYAEAVQDKRPFLGIGASEVKPLERMVGSWAAQEMRRRVRER